MKKNHNSAREYSVAGLQAIVFSPANATAPETRAKWHSLFIASDQNHNTLRRDAHVIQTGDSVIHKYTVTYRRGSVELE